MSTFARTLSILIIVLAMLVTLSTQVKERKNNSRPTSYFGMTLLAHAGGGIPQGRYSNAKEAFDLSASLNHQFIEVDFSVTEDGDLVLIHDWDIRHYQYFSYMSFLPEILQRLNPKPAKSVSDFKQRKMKFGLTQMSLDDLLRWMKNNPDVKIITDIKFNNATHLKTIYNHAGPLADRIIPQIYTTDEYDLIKTIGYDNIIFTNYRSKLDTEALILFISTYKLFALTVPIDNATPDLIEGAVQSDTPIFVHKYHHWTPLSLVNTPEGADILRSKGISGIYTDYLYPEMAMPNL